MPRVWKKVPRVTRECACGCGELTTGTARRMYAKPYCKLRAYLLRKNPNAFTIRRRRTPNPLDKVIPFTLGEDIEDVSGSV